MKPAPPVTRMFFTSSSASNLVLPTKIGACFDSSSATYDRGLSMVEFRRAGSQLVSGECTCIRGGDIRLTPLAPYGAGSSASGLWTAVIVEWRSVAAIHKERDFSSGASSATSEIARRVIYTSCILMSDKFVL